MKRNFTLGIVLVFVFTFSALLPITILAQENAMNVMVQIAPGKTQVKSFTEYIGDIYQLILVVAVMLAFLYIVWGGVEYINPLSSKQVAKDRITKAIVGLLIVLGTYFLLNLINPDIFNVNLF